VPEWLRWPPPEVLEKPPSQYNQTSGSSRPADLQHGVTLEAENRELFQVPVPHTRAPSAPEIGMDKKIVQGRIPVATVKVIQVPSRRTELMREHQIQTQHPLIRFINGGRI
jgi:hypothetical protein